jgi:hypothetical protein
MTDMKKKKKNEQIKRLMVQSCQGTVVLVGTMNADKESRFIAPLSLTLGARWV